MASATETTPSMRSFLIMWSGQAFSLFGNNLVQFVLVWYMTLETQSATVLTIGTMMGLLPQVLFGPFAGALIDRWNRRTVLITANVIIMAATVVLVGLFALDVIEIWHIYILLFVRALGQAFLMPATLAATSTMVPEERLSQVSGLNQLLEGAMMIVPPLAGALLLSLLSMDVILGLDILAGLIAVGLLFLIKIPQPVRMTLLTKNVSVLEDMWTGFKYILGWPGLLILILVCSALNFFFSPAFALLPLIVTNFFNGGATELAWVDSSLAGGLIVGGLIMGAWGGFKKRIVSTIVFGALGGVCLAVFGLLPANLFLVGIAVLGVFGAMLAMDNGPLMAIPQSAVEPKMQGRVLAVMNAIAMGISPIGLAVAGPLSDQIGARTWFVIAGGAAVALSLMMRFIPAVMHIEDRIHEKAGTGEHPAAQPTVQSAAAAAEPTAQIDAAESAADALKSSGVRAAALPTNVFNAQPATYHFTRNEVLALRAAAERKKQKDTGK
jgi:DHA3 family macrolide efflux protein-like MFS transporter